MDKYKPVLVGLFSFGHFGNSFVDFDFKKKKVDRNIKNSNIIERNYLTG